MIWDVPSKRVLSTSKGDRRWNSDTEVVEEWNGEKWVQINHFNFPLETIPFRNLEFGKTYKYHLFQMLGESLFQIYEEGICTVVSYKPTIISLEFTGVDYEIAKNTTYLMLNMNEEEYYDKDFVLRYES